MNYLFPKILQRKNWRFIDSIVASGTLNLRAWRKSNWKSSSTDGLMDYYIHESIAFGESIVSKITKNDIEKPSRSFVLSIFTAFLTYGWQLGMAEGWKKIDKGKCTKCGLCAEKICVSSAIKWKIGEFPKINHLKCVGCSGCVNICPQGAIYTGWNKNKQPYTTYSDYILKN